MRVKLIVLRSALVILALLTLLGAVLTFRDQGMDWDWGISILVAWWMTVVVAAAGTVFAAGRLRIPMVIAIACAVTLVCMLYADVDGDWPIASGLWLAPVGLVHIGLLSLLDLRPSRPARLIRVATFVAVGVLTVGIFLEAIEAIELQAPYDDWYQRFLIFVSMLNGAGTIALYLLAAIGSQERSAAESLPPRVSLSAACPRCKAVNTFPAGRSECQSCGLRVTLDIEEPRCPCGYLLYKLDSPNCPECGRAVRHSSVNDRITTSL